MARPRRASCVRLKQGRTCEHPSNKTCLYFGPLCRSPEPSTPRRLSHVKVKRFRRQAQTETKPSTDTHQRIVSISDSSQTPQYQAHRSPPSTSESSIFIDNNSSLDPEGARLALMAPVDIMNNPPPPPPSLIHPSPTPYRQNCICSRL